MASGDDLASRVAVVCVVSDADVVSAYLLDIGHMSESTISWKGIPLGDGSDARRAVDLVSSEFGPYSIVPLVGVAERRPRVSETVLL